MLNHPLTSMMFCAPDEGAAALVMCRAEIADRYTANPIFVRASEIRTRSYGAYEVNTSWAAIEEEPAPPLFASSEAYAARGPGPAAGNGLPRQETAEHGKSTGR